MLANLKMRLPRKPVVTSLLGKMDSLAPRAVGGNQARGVSESDRLRRGH